MPDIKNFEEKLNLLKEHNELTPENLEQLVFKTLNNSEDIKNESKIVFVKFFEYLKNFSIANKEYLKALVEGIIKANTKGLENTINSLLEEKRKILNQLQRYQDEYFEKVNSVLENIKIISDELGDDVQTKIEVSIKELTSKNERAVFEMQKAIKEEIKKAVENKKDISAELKKSVNKSIQNALENSDLTISQAKEIFKKAILSVKELSEEMKLNVRENIETAVKSAEEYVLSQINELKSYLDESKNDITDFVQKDAQKTLENLEIIYIGMVEAIGEFSQKGEKFLQAELDDMKKKIAELKDEVREILIQKIEMLKKESEDALNRAKEKTKILTDEMKQKLENLSLKIAKVTKGAISGMIEGAKKALEEEN